MGLVALFHIYQGDHAFKGDSHRTADSLLMGLPFFHLAIVTLVSVASQLGDVRRHGSGRRGALGHGFDGFGTFALWTYKLVFSENLFFCGASLMPLSAYENQRLDNIERNAKVMASLGLAPNSTLTKRKLPNAPATVSNKKKRGGYGHKKSIDASASRFSNRLAGLDRKFYGYDDASDKEIFHVESSPLYLTHANGSRKSGRSNLGKRPQQIYTPELHTPKKRRCSGFVSEDSASDDEAADSLCFCGNFGDIGCGQYIQCDKCDRWCHFECANVDEDDVDAISYTCHICTGSSSDSDDDEFCQHPKIAIKTIIPTSIPTRKSGNVEVVHVPPPRPRVTVDIGGACVRLNLTVSSFGIVSAALSTSAIAVGLSITSGGILSTKSGVQDARNALVTSQQILKQFPVGNSATANPLTIAEDSADVAVLDMLRFIDDKVSCINSVCDDPTHVVNLGGGTRLPNGISKYRYRCLTCGKTWQQVPPHKCEGFDFGITEKKYNKRRAFNFCSRCPGVPKKGHVCPLK